MASPILVLVSRLMIVLPYTIAQSCNSITARDLGNSTAPSSEGLVAAILAVAEEQPNLQVQILRYNLVCESTAGRGDEFRFLSMVVEYLWNGSIIQSQFEFSCGSVMGVNEWGIEVSGSTDQTVTTPPDAALNTTLRRDCYQCLSPQRPGSTSNNSEHCLECNSHCFGRLMCATAFSCCNFLAPSGNCMSACPSNSNSTQSFDCVCLPGFTGGDCSIDIDKCLSNPCLNGGNCTEGVNSFSCACQPGFTGGDCSIDIDECLSNPCLNDGNCTDGVNSFSCACQPGFTGGNCSIDIDECLSNPCLNGGNCTEGINSFNCACLPGFTGGDCSIDIDECLSNPCLNGGNCTEGVNSFSCACLPGFTGGDCSIDVDECLSNPCLNNGNCADNVNSFSCTCLPGFTGDDCSIDIDECSFNPCLNDGSCTDGVNSYSCECGVGYTGMNCSVQTECGVSCQNGGTCVLEEGRASCQCASGFTGNLCQGASFFMEPNSVPSVDCGRACIVAIVTPFALLTVLATLVNVVIVAVSVRKRARWKAKEAIKKKEQKKNASVTNIVTSKPSHVTNVTSDTSHVTSDTSHVTSCVTSDTSRVISDISHVTVSSSLDSRNISRSTLKSHASVSLETFTRIFNQRWHKPNKNKHKQSRDNIIIVISDK